MKFFFTNPNMIFTSSFHSIQCCESSHVYHSSDTSLFHHAWMHACTHTLSLSCMHMHTCMLSLLPSLSLSLKICIQGTKGIYYFMCYSFALLFTSKYYC